MCPVGEAADLESSFLCVGAFGPNRGALQTAVPSMKANSLSFKVACEVHGPVVSMLCGFQGRQSDS